MYIYTYECVSINAMCIFIMCTATGFLLRQLLQHAAKKQRLLLGNLLC